VANKLVIGIEVCEVIEDDEGVEEAMPATSAIFAARVIMGTCLASC